MFCKLKLWLILTFITAVYRLLNIVDSTSAVRVYAYIL